MYLMKHHGRPSQLGVHQFSEGEFNPAEAKLSSRWENVSIPYVHLIDMRSDYDEVLMDRFYNELMIPNFPLEDELDSLEYMKSMVLSSREEDSTYKEFEFVDYHMLIMVKLNEPYDPSVKYDYSLDRFQGEIMGGVVFEYYIQANTGLLTYLMVNVKWRGLRLGSLLAEKCRDMLEAHAKSRGHLAGCNAIFLETNSATKIKDLVDVMPISKRHKIFYDMGLRLVDFDYVQAPLDKDKRKVNYLLLCCFITPRIPSTMVGQKECYYLPSTLLRNTIYAFWSNAPIKGRKFSEDVDYKRMQDQLKRRDHIALLDLPWERPFTVVDLHEHFDLELLVQFYQDLLVPCYKGCDGELDSLDRWLELLSNKQHIHDDSQVVFHLLLALKYSDDEEENSKPIISGGLSFEYFPTNNCGFLTYLLVPIGERGERMAYALIARALSELDNDAKMRGLLGGCNVIFMECSQAGGISIPSQMQEIQDIELQHPLLESMGWKMVDFDYVQPPNQDPSKKVKSMFLIALVTPRIPMLVQEDVKRLYLPTSTLKKFMVDLWDQACVRLNFNYKLDQDFLTMIDRIDRRPRIPLLSRPWNKPWTMCDLQENASLELLKQFYVELLQPVFVNHLFDLEPPEVWLKKLTCSLKSTELFHILLAIKPSTEDGSGVPPPILGGLAFNYFEGTNCGFITHAIIRDLTNREIIAKSLMERAVGILDEDAVTRGNLAGCNAIFLETTDPNFLTREEEGGANVEADGTQPTQLEMPIQNTDQYIDQQGRPVNLNAGQDVTGQINRNPDVRNQTSLDHSAPTQQQGWNSDVIIPAVSMSPSYQATYPALSHSEKLDFSPKPRPCSSKISDPYYENMTSHHRSLISQPVFGHENVSNELVNADQNTTSFSFRRKEELTDAKEDFDRQNSEAYYSNVSILDMSIQHEMLYRLGWRLVDFNYVAPPSRAGLPPMLTKSLAIFLTVRVPKVELVTEDESYYYLPQQMLTSFISEYWKITTATQRYEYRKDPRFLNMIDLISRRERIPLLDLPWERPWTLVDLWEDFDAQLLYKFYQNYYATTFPDKAQREPLSTWLQLLSSENRDVPSAEDFHVLLALQYPLSASSTLQKTSTANIISGLLFTYFTTNNCGLLTFMSVPTQYTNSELLARNLIDEATVNLNENAVLRGHIAGCNAIFMEAPPSSSTYINTNTIFNQTRPDHDILYRGGWRMLNFEYYRPPLSIFSTGGVPFLLLALLTPNIPREKDQNNQYTYYIPKEMLTSFLSHNWRTTFHRIGKSIVTKDMHYKKMMDSLKDVDRVKLLDLPWIAPQAKL